MTPLYNMFEQARTSPSRDWVDHPRNVHSKRQLAWHDRAFDHWYTDEIFNVVRPQYPQAR